mmetsp:Transcript_18700/g.49296  ORF Transcript_18700/g.49296 Transcript_18700/m.49296 type:complete len:216 (+) Transcript_18700:509-1156(+)
MSPLACTRATSFSFRASSSSICSWISASFSIAAAYTAFLPFSLIQSGGSAPANCSSDTLHAAQRFAHLSSSSSSAAIHSGTSLLSAFRRLASLTAHFIWPCRASFATMSSIHWGAVMLLSCISFTDCFAHISVACWATLCFFSSQVRDDSLLHHSGALSGRDPNMFQNLLLGPVAPSCLRDAAPAISPAERAHCSSGAIPARGWGVGLAAEKKLR